MPKKTQSSFASEVKTSRLRAGMTQAQVAEAAGLTQAAVAMIERGDREPSLASARKLAQALGVSLQSLLVNVPL